MDLVDDHCVPDCVDHLETWKGMEDVLSKGMTRAIGLSNFNMQQIQRILDNSAVKPHNVQVECHLYWPQFELHDFCAKHNISFTAYTPLGNPGRITHSLTNIGVDVSKQREPLNDPLVKDIAAKHGKSPAQILLKWLLQRDIIVIPKSTNAAHMQENFQLFDFELGSDEMKAMNEVKTREKHLPFNWARNHPQFPFER
uniref:Aldo_ket_red domain-containing protein n=1 Tax=Trichuris muris TaxID=70415 RepID=A0A5S6Q395_TRIMR